ncbi:MAG TPA: hypothetical protein VE397_13020, partial [Stellaceae bacterium]|nr:hypothetical protein [Stellaceae bacterium]
MSSARVPAAAPPRESADAGVAAARATEAVIAFAAADYNLASTVAGRRSASAGFLAAYLRQATRFACLVREAEDAGAFRELVERHAGVEGPVDLLRWDDIAGLAEIGTLYTPGPDLGAYAWLRRGGDQRGFSLVGVTHTLSEAHAMDAVGRLLTAPVQAWDA